jgi:hypothetical protein
MPSLPGVKKNVWNPNVPRRCTLNNWSPT